MSRIEIREGVHKIRAFRDDTVVAVAWRSRAAAWYCTRLPGSGGWVLDKATAVRHLIELAAEPEGSTR